MRVLVTGDRNWVDSETLNIVLNSLDEKYGIDAIIQGECPTGADAWARIWAKNHKIVLESFPADWDTYGKKAGPIRNQQMLEEGDPDIICAFHYDLANSRGTKDCVKRALKYGYTVFLNSLSIVVTAVNGPVLEEIDSVDFILSDLAKIKLGDGTWPISVVSSGKYSGKYEVATVSGDTFYFKDLVVNDGTYTATIVSDSTKPDGEKF